MRLLATGGCPTAPAETCLTPEARAPDAAITGAGQQAQPGRAVDECDAADKRGVAHAECLDLRHALLQPSMREVTSLRCAQGPTQGPACSGQHCVDPTQASIHEQGPAAHRPHKQPGPFKAARAASLVCLSAPSLPDEQQRRSSGERESTLARTRRRAVPVVTEPATSQPRQLAGAPAAARAAAHSHGPCHRGLRSPAGARSARLPAP